MDLTKYKTVLDFKNKPVGPLIRTAIGLGVYSFLIVGFAYEFKDYMS